MSRFSDDDEEFPGEWLLREANRERALNGKRGRVALLQVEEALLAMPVKRLITGALVNRSGEVCALGALARHQHVPLPAPVDDGDDEGYHENTARIGRLCGLTGPVAEEIAWQNDDGLWLSSGPLTPEQRYEAMLAWVRRRLAVHSLSPTAATA